MESIKMEYPEDYNDEDKATYDDLISRGMALVGTKVKQDDIWLLHLSAKIVINQAKGYNTGITKEEIEITKKLHRDTMNTNIFDTPPHLYEGDMMRTEDGDERPHPLAKTQEECFAEMMKKPDEDGVDYLNGKIDEMLEVN